MSKAPKDGISFANSLSTFAFTAGEGTSVSWSGVRDDTGTIGQKVAFRNNGGVNTGTNTERSTGVVFAAPTGVRAINRLLLIVKTSEIKDPPAEAKLNLRLGSILNTNAASGDNTTKWAIVKASKDFITANTENSTALVGSGGSSPGAGYWDDIDGWTAGQAWNSTLYADVIENSSLIASADNEIILNKQARIDMANFDCLAFYVLNYTHDVLNQDPATVSGNAGSTVLINLNIETISCNVIFTFGKIKDSIPDKERIEKDFTINSFADITSQRARFTKDGVILDQVPFLLGTKGPLSLRGRQFDSTGAPISTTVKPPNTSKS